MSAKHGRNSRLLLIIDQFEEVFTLCQGVQAERDRHSFFNSLITALREIGDCFSVVVVLRADFFGKYSLYNGLAQQIEQQLVTVTPLTYAQIKASIVKPAAKAGIVCEPNLIYNILLDIVGAPGELPLLQYTLFELWQQRHLDPDGGPAHLTLDAYNELGGVRGTLQKRANDLFYSLTHEEQRVAKQVFIALTQIGDGTEDTRRRIAKAELVSPWFPAALVERVLEKLVTAKLVVTNRVPSSCHHQERVGQGFANVSTALSFAQMRQGKGLQQHSDIDHAPFLLEDRIDGGLVGLTRRSTHELAALTTAQSSSGAYQETVDVAHEALIRHWSLLRTWLDENRELLQRQRRIEHAAKEWSVSEQTRPPEYLLHGDRLIEAEDYLIAYPDQLTALAQRYIAVSREESRRAQKERRLLQLAVPCTLLVALVVTFSQYRAVVNSQAEKEYQLQIATSRQQAAVAQAILQEPESDPTTALLISRLAAEKGGYTYEAQASLRLALQKLRLQANLQGHQGAIHQVIFSPNQRQLATAGDDGTVRLWSLETQTVEKILSWRDDRNQPSLSGQAVSDNSQRPPPIVAIAFSPDGQKLAATAQNSTDVQVWSVGSGKRLLTLSSLKAPVRHLQFSPNGDWIAASAGSEVRVWDANSGQSQASLRHTASVRSLTFNPDSQELLTTSGTIAQLWQVAQGRTRKLLHHPTFVNSATFSPDGQSIATACGDGSTRLWQSRTGQLRTVLPADTIPTQYSNQRQLAGQSSQPMAQVLFSPNGRFLAAAAANHVQLWTVKTGQPWHQLELHDELSAPDQTGQDALGQNKLTSSIAFSPNSHQLVITDREWGEYHTLEAARLWDVQSGELVGNLKGHSGAIEAVQFSGNGSLIATASTDGSARLWATEMGSEFPLLKPSKGQRQWAAFRYQPQVVPLNQPQSSIAMLRASLLPQSMEAPPEGFEDMVTVAINGTLRTWNPTKPRARSSNATRAASVIPGQPWFPARLAEISAFKFLSIFGVVIEPALDVLQPALLESTLLPSGALPTATSASTISADSLLRLRDILPATEGQKLAGSAMTPRIPERLIGRLPFSTELTGVAFSADTQLIATATNGVVDLWQVQADQSLKPVRRFDDSTPATATRGSTNQTTSTRLEPIHQLAFSPDGKTLLGVGDRIIYLWDSTSGKLTQRLQGHEGSIEQAQFSADSQRVVSASRDHTARLWQIASSHLITTLHYRDVVSSAHFSPDGQLIAIASWDGTARVLNAATGAVQVVMAGHRGAVLDAEFSPDATTLVTASADGTVRLWDAKTGAEQALLRSAEPGFTQEQIQQAFFSPDGRYVASLNKNGDLHLWAATWEELLYLARDRSLRQLQPEECLRYLRLPPSACPALELPGAVPHPI